MEPAFDPTSFISTPEHYQLVERVYHGQNLVIVGPPGSGKTSLVKFYIYQYGEMHSPLLYLRGRNLTEDRDLESSIWKPLRGTNSSTFDGRKRPLLVIDGLDEINPSSPVLPALADAFRSVEIQILITTRSFSHQIFHPAIVNEDFAILSLSAFTQDVVAKMLQQFNVVFSPDRLHQLVSLSNGSPLIVSLVASQLASGALAWNQLDAAFSEFECSGILLPNGRPADQVQRESRLFVSDIATTNENIWRELQRYPEKLREMPPRKFEEFVAAMLEKQGYTVKLTPTARDGGFDIYVAIKQPLGSFLYLVECKRYTPPNKVGIHLIRALHGVVQKTRANAGMLVTTSFFTKSARDYADEVKWTLHLHDFLALKEWLKLL